MRKLTFEEFKSEFNELMEKGVTEDEKEIFYYWYLWGRRTVRL